MSMVDPQKKSPPDVNVSVLWSDPVSFRGFAPRWLKPVSHLAFDRPQIRV